MDFTEHEELQPLLDTVIPDDSSLPYDMHDVVRILLDEDSVMELQPYYADNIITCFGRLGGHSVGVIANQPFSMGGSLDINASDKAARFIQLCDAFGIPLINLVDVPGFLPGADQEHAGIIRHGAKLLYVYSVAEVPKLTVVLRKAYGGSYLAMCSKDLGADFVYAWPTAEIAVMARPARPTWSSVKRSRRRRIRKRPAGKKFSSIPSSLPRHIWRPPAASWIWSSAPRRPGRGCWRRWSC